MEVRHEIDFHFQDMRLEKGVIGDELQTGQFDRLSIASHAQIGFDTMGRKCSISNVS
jgi:hypothetical protein